jgi:hypothetical protein
VNIDLGSPILDVAIAVAFVFFLLSLLASAIREFFAGVFGLRSKTLVKGLEGMLGDAQVVSELMEHPLVRTDLRKAKPPRSLKYPQELSAAQRLGRHERGPSYIAPRNFALALESILQALSRNPEDAAKQGDGEHTREEAERARVSLWKQIDALSEEWGALPPVASIEKWFDDSMDRVSGWYKRTSQYWMIAIALFIAVGLNASAIRLVERFEAEPTVRSAVVKQAEAAIDNKDFKNQTKEEEEAATGKTAEPNATEQVEAAGKQASKAIGNIEDLKLPLWWAGENVPVGWSQIAVAALGWLITAIAVSLGAPFWFDALGKLANLRMAGKNSEEKEKGKN